MQSRRDGEPLSAKNFIDRFDFDSGSYALRPLSAVYAAGRVMHRGLYRTGIKHRNKLAKPVICVGNLTVGGTGKTPMLIALAAEMKSRGIRAAILSRGYGAQPKADPPRVVSDGMKFRCSMAEAGDEPYLLARSCPGVPVLIGSSRFAAGELASREFDPDLFLLDDGFQHEALAREVDLALWDVRDMPNRMRQLPAGRLREGLGALRRATAIILTHAEYIPADGREDRIRRIIEQIKLHAPGARILDALTELAGYRNLASADEGSGLPQFAYRPMSELAGKRAILVSGLARADGFEQMVRDARIEVSGHLSFRDHARYDARTLDSIREALKSSGAELALTTEKDAVKFEAMNIGEYDVPICAIGLRMSLRQASDWNLILEETLRSVHKRGEDKD